MCRAPGWCIIIWLSMAGWRAAGQDCRTPESYQEGGYSVGRIRIDTPLGFLGPVHRAVEELKNELPLKERGLNPDGTVRESSKFTKGSLDAGVQVLRDKFAPLR